MQARILVRCVATFAVLSFSACGGGGDQAASLPASPPLPVTFAIGGSVTGLVGSVTLQNSGGDSIEVTANGTFSFPTRVARGGAYSATVARQPSGPDCNVAAGTGTAAADVTTVRVACTVDPETRYVVLVGSDEAGRSVGLHVLSNKQPDRPPIRIVSGAVEVVSLLADHTLDTAGVVTSARPGMVVYRTVGAPGGDHLWSLDLTGRSTLQPRQLGSLTLDAGLLPSAAAARPVLCGRFNVQRDLRDASSAFHLLIVSRDRQRGCLAEDGSGVELDLIMVLSSDLPDTAPRPITVLGTNGQLFDPNYLEPVYGADGRLAGLYALNPRDANIVFYRDETFVNPATALRGVQYFFPVPEFRNFAPEWTDRAGRQTQSVFVVTGTDSIDAFSADGGGSLTRLAQMTTSRGPIVVGDDVYLHVASSPASPSQYEIVRIPVGSPGAAATLWSGSASFDCETFDFLSAFPDSLLMSRSCDPAEPDRVSTDVVTILRHQPGSASPWARYAGRSIINAAASAEHVVLALSGVDPGVTPPRGRFTTETRSRSGVVTQPEVPGGLPLPTNGFHDAVVQVRDVTGEGLSGGSLFGLVLSGAAAPRVVPVRTAAGAAILMPEGQGFLEFFPIGRNVFYGFTFSRTAGQRDLVIDLSRGLAIPPDVPGVLLTLQRFSR